ncbi:unnamed protein product, partial [Brenthis ino]
MIKVWRLGLLGYDTAYKIQSTIARKHLDAIAKGSAANYDTLLLVEHKPVYTTGIRDKISKEETLRLCRLGAEFRNTNRGGLITFHGPGQLVVYPIINLKYFKPSVKWYVDSLEATVINLCEELGIKANRSPHTGVWVGDNKIAAIGVHASRYITTHGISLNCNIDLSWFSHIDPCGIPDKGVTSITKETGEEYSIDKIIPIFINHFERVFGCNSEVIDIDSQQEILSNVYSKLMVELG